jgi:ADP-ribosyltransferase exoenzyme
MPSSPGDRPRFEPDYDPPTYPGQTAGKVEYAPVSKAGRVVGYLWAAADDDAAGFVYRGDVGPDGFNTGVAWVVRLRQSKARDLTPLQAFAYWCAHGAPEGFAIGPAQQAPTLQALHQLAGRDPEREQRDREAAEAAWLRAHPPRNPAARAFTEIQAALGDRTARRQVLAEQVRLIDAALRVHPIPEDIWVWWTPDANTFQRAWPDLPGSRHQQPGYLSVALVHTDDLADAEAVVHLRVPAGVPGIYLNLFDDDARLSTPTLLLARGLTIAVHAADQRGGQWRLEAEILPVQGAGPTRGVASA